MRETRHAGGGRAKEERRNGGEGDSLVPRMSNRAGLSPEMHMRGKREGAAKEVMEVKEETVSGCIGLSIPYFPRSADRKTGGSPDRKTRQKRLIGRRYRVFSDVTAPKHPRRAPYTPAQRIITIYRRISLSPISPAGESTLPLPYSKSSSPPPTSQSRHSFHDDREFSPGPNRRSSVARARVAAP